MLPSSVNSVKIRPKANLGKKKNSNVRKQESYVREAKQKQSTECKKIEKQCKKMIIRTQEKQQIINDTKEKTQCKLNSVKRIGKPNFHEKQLLKFKKKNIQYKKSIKNV